MDDKVSYNKAIDIAVQFAHKIRSELDPQAEIYLYGSVITKTNNLGSDIDIAVVSRTFTDDVCSNYACVNLLAFDVNDKIDAQAIIYDDWINKTPFVTEVQKHGVPVK